MKVVVIGAGVLGAATSYQLAKRNCEVTLIDKSVPGDAASAASLAWLNSNNKTPRNYHDLNVMSVAEWSAIARELGSSSWLHMSGNVHVAGTRADADALLTRAERLNSYGYAAIPMHPEELSRLDPVIRVRDEYQSAVYFPGEGHITVPLLIHNLLQAAKALGTTIRDNTEVTHLSSNGSRITGVVLEDGDRIDADVVLLAAGAGIGTLMESHGVKVKTEGAPGVTVTTSPGASTLTTMLHLPGLSVRPDSSGRLVVRSEQSDTQIDRSSWTLPTTEVRRLFELTSASLTDLDPTSVRAERVQIAHRPYPFDGLPVVGHWDGLPGLYVMTMHSGVTQGAIMSRLAAEEITTETATRLLDGFRPSRVTNADEDNAAHYDPYASEGEREIARP